MDKGADYVISLKGNQGNLHQDIKDYLDWAERIEFKDIKYDYYETLGAQASCLHRLRKQSKNFDYFQY